MKLSEFFEGRERLKVEGYNLSKLVRAITEHVEIYNYKLAGSHKIEFDIASRSRKTVIAILNDMCYNDYSIISRKGLHAVLYASRTRIPLIVCLAAVFALLVLFNGFVWAINIEGNERVLKSDVVKSLNLAGVRTGVFKTKVSPKKLANMLTAEYDDISAVHVKTRGISLTVEIVETLDKNDVLDRADLSDIVASEDGRVDKLLVYQGTPLVKTGDFVRKGEVIIGAYEDRLLPDGITTERLFMKALGEADMTVWYTHELEFSEKTEEFVRTGKSKSSSSLKIFGWEFFFRGRNKFACSESVSYTQTLNSGTLLPIKKRIHIFYELKKVEVTRSFSEQENVLKTNALLEARIKTPINADIIEEYVNVSVENELYRITGVVAVKTTITAK